MSFIEDGTGDGYSAKVTSGNRLSVLADIETVETQHVKNGDSFNVETPVITLTSGAKSGVLYIKNTGEKDIVITGFFNLTGPSTGALATEHMLLHYEFNTTAGTLLSATSNVVTAVNKRVGSNKTLPATIQYGAQGLTVDASLTGITSVSTSAGRNTLLLTLALPKSQSVSVSITPFSSNTSMVLIAALDCYIEQDL